MGAYQNMTTSLTEVGRWVDSQYDFFGANYNNQLVYDGTYLYVGTVHNGPSSSLLPQVIKVDPTTMLEVARWTDTVLTDAIALSMTGDGTYIYVGLSSSGTVIQIDPATMSEVTRLNADPNNSVSWLDFDGTSIYACLIYPSVLVQIDPTTMLETGEWTNPVDEASWAVTHDGAYLYVVTDSAVVKIDKTTLLEVTRWTSGVNLTYCIIDNDDTFIYIGKPYSFPAQVAQIDAATLSHVTYWTSSSGDYGVLGLAHNGTNLAVETGYKFSNTAVALLDTTTMTQITKYQDTLTPGGSDYWAGNFIYAESNYHEIIKLTMSTGPTNITVHMTYPVKRRKI
jgi:hypothetical protein